MSGGDMRFPGRLHQLLLGAAVAALAWAWQFETPPPDLMEDLAAAASLRPPVGSVSQLWHLLASALCRSFGLPAAEAALRAMGHVSLGALAVLSASLFGMLLPASFRRGERVAAWWRATTRTVLFLPAAFFCLSDPVWSSFRWLSPSALQTLLAAAAAACYLDHFRTARRAPLFAAFAVLGLLAADTPVAAVLLALAALGLRARARLQLLGLAAVPDENPLAQSQMPWRLTLAAALGALAGALLEALSFASLDGLAAFGWSWADYVCKVPFIYVKTLLATCSPAGFVLVVSVAVLPVIVEARLARRAMDEERHLAYSHGVVFLACGLAAFSQFTGARSLWFWKWAGECVRDGLLKNAAMFLCALAALWALAVFMFELYLRSFRRVQTLRLPDAAAERGAAEAFATLARVRRAVRAVLFAAPVLALACVVPFRAQRLERAMLAVVADAARETAAECAGADWIFTDGGLDAAVELAAAERGGRLRALSLLGSAVEPRDVYLRTRGAADADERALLASGAPDALRTWVRTRPDKSGAYAVQIGFELWRRDGRPMPECSGLVARPSGFAPGEAERGAAQGRALAERVVALYDGANPDAVPDRALRDAFLFVQWRLAVLARHRANACDAQGERALAVEETRLSDELDRRNAALPRIRESMSWASRRKLERMTPREGLRAGLLRADFALARVFARRVLDTSPDDPEANFAVGMDYFVQRQYARAQAHLERCLERRPNDPAVLNNIAQCRLRQGDPAGALPYAERALAVLPDSQEIKRTLERIKSDLAH